MRRLNLETVEHSMKHGDTVPAMPPNLREDTMFLLDGEVVGFYMRQVPDRLAKLASVADFELRSKRVPKSEMKRSASITTNAKEVVQYSTILGSIPPKPHMKRPYATRSSVHRIESARAFTKAMVMAGQESLKLIRRVAPEVYKRHESAVKERVPERWRFADLFTSTISNYNISADIHQDRLNVKGAVNVIITKRRNSTGGDLYIPDFDATLDCCDGSIIVYPAWRSAHGVTPIVPTHDGGYRNSLVWYALDSFYNA